VLRSTLLDVFVAFFSDVCIHLGQVILEQAVKLIGLRLHLFQQVDSFTDITIKIKQFNPVFSSPGD